MMEIATPVYGYKSHVGVDRRHRFIRTWSVTDAARHDGRELPGLLDRSNTGSSVWADTAYRSAKNEKRIAKAGLVSKVHFRKPPGKPMPEPKLRANAARSRERSGVEHVFADQKHRMGLFVRSTASPERAPRSASPTSPTTCAGFCSGRRQLRSHSAEAPNSSISERQTLTQAAQLLWTPGHHPPH